jgi:polysaccharide export outer membrane protein
MRGARFLLAVLAALAAASCARQQQAYVIDPATGQPVPVVMQQPYAQPQYAQQTYQQPVAPPAPSGGRGLFNARPSAPQAYLQQPVQQAVQQPYVLQYGAPQYAAPQNAAPQYAAPQYAAPPYAAPPYGAGGPYVAAPYGYAAASPYEQPYTLDAGDRLRIVVFGQDGISNSYIVDAGGNVNLPLVGVVPARGATTQQLSQMIAERLKQGYVREPHVSVEVEAYRPFFILGEVTNPGQYPYVADMTVEKAIAIAGGFAPRANKSKVELSRNAPGQPIKGEVPLTYPLRPGDTVVVKERWF